MKAEIFRHGIDWYVEFYREDGSHMDYCGEWISGFCENPLRRAIERAKFWNCKSICVIY